ncbi:hypothetical protein CAOG_06186 [Capsaspora owczarzaki ATCC 30864]|uniref:Uncharacterized protein n=1 Tax=Capsaspora owczarzaki (strain ATCC 30864) TaxID=595528 RepID=A0A0D2WUS6_CAPO3|nr:hypothetical protein CAOG_06186 [Capsaspora owczarzaki ATCC 30864]KJE95773.1 hypothetical protein CAOG_006186 [Capsaspora owczarzaki ATCC 30864]|eukprot:XP_004345776.1 hypothetical protein CAOG_06186 [Capsaspora owczarzaki ATCC 30864]
MALNELTDLLVQAPVSLLVLVVPALLPPSWRPQSLDADHVKGAMPASTHGQSLWSTLFSRSGGGASSVLLGGTSSSLSSSSSSYSAYDALPELGDPNEPFVAVLLSGIAFVGLLLLLAGHRFFSQFVFGVAFVAAFATLAKLDSASDGAGTILPNIAAALVVAMATLFTYRVVCTRMATIVGAGLGLVLACFVYVGTVVVLSTLGGSALMNFQLHCVPAVAALEPFTNGIFGAITAILEGFVATSVGPDADAGRGLSDKAHSASSYRSAARATTSPSSSSDGSWWPFSGFFGGHVPPAAPQMQITYASLIVLLALIVSISVGRLVAKSLHESFIVRLIPTWVDKCFAPVRFISYIVGFLTYAILTHVTHVYLDASDSSAFVLDVDPTDIFHPLLVPLTLTLKPWRLAQLLAVPVISAGFVHGFSIAASLLWQLEMLVSSAVGASMLFALPRLVKVEEPVSGSLVIWFLLVILGATVQNTHAGAEGDVRPPPTPSSARSPSSGSSSAFFIERPGSRSSPTVFFRETAYLDD